MQNMSKNMSNNMFNVSNNMSNMQFRANTSLDVTNMENMQNNMRNMHNMQSWFQYVEYALPTLLMNMFNNHVSTQHLSAPSCPWSTRGPVEPWIIPWWRDNHRHCEGRGPRLADSAGPVGRRLGGPSTGLGEGAGCRHLLWAHRAGGGSDSRQASRPIRQSP
jgi:hypothetical protein